MDTDVAPEPGVIGRVDIDRPAPEPADCLCPHEEPTATVGLSPGWVAVTDRELLVFHPDQDPALTRTPRPNVSGIAVRRAGARTFLPYVPKIALLALFSAVFGVILLSVSPDGLVTIPDAPGSGQLEGIVGALGSAMRLLGVVLVFVAVLAVLSATVVVGYWLLSRDVVLAIERGNADPIECPTTRTNGTRVLRKLEPELTGNSKLN